MNGPMPKGNGSASQTVAGPTSGHKIVAAKFVQNKMPKGQTHKQGYKASRRKRK